MKSHRPSQIQASAVTIDALAMSNGVHSKEDLDQIRAASWGKAQAGRGIGTCTLLHDAGGVGNPGGRGESNMALPALVKAVSVAYIPSARTLGLLLLVTGTPSLPASSNSRCPKTRMGIPQKALRISETSPECSPMIQPPGGPCWI
jgi:hypothetical protein